MALGAVQRGSLRYGCRVIAERTELVDVGRGPRLHLVHWGEGNDDPHPHLLVHGLASNARLWDGVGMALAAAGRRAVAVDLRGHGHSDKPDDGYDMASVADDLAALLDTLGWAAPVVSGQSWGANVVLELGARHPTRAAAVVCVDGGTIHLADRFPDFDACWEVLAPPRFPPDLTLATMEARMRAGRSSWPETGITGALACFEELPDGSARPWLTRDRHRMVLAGLFEHDPQQRFGAVVVPLLFIAADTGEQAWTRDKKAAVDAAVAALRDGRAQWFSPADHDVHAQYPEEVAELLIELADEVATDRPEGRS